MDALEIGSLRGLRFERLDGIGEIGAPHAVEDRVETFRSLGMARPGEMLQVCRMSGEQHGHAARRYLAPVDSELPFPS